MNPGYSFLAAWPGQLFRLGLLLLISWPGFFLSSCSDPIVTNPPVTVPATVVTSQTPTTTVTSQSAVSPTELPTNLPTTPATSAPAITTTVTTGPLVFALLADNHLLALRIGDGATVADLALAPPASPSVGRVPGHYLALSSDGQTLYILVPGTDSQPDRMSLIDTSSAHLLATYPLPQSEARFAGLDFTSGVYHSLAVGPQTGRIYLAGTQLGRVVISVFNPTSRQITTTWPGRDRDSLHWLPYQIGLAADEKTLFVSYHGEDTTGIDRFELDGNGLQRWPCPPAQEKPGWGCLGAHGSFILREEKNQPPTMLTTYGYGVISEQDWQGRVRQGFNTGLNGSHVTEFAVDSARQRLYSVDSCIAPPGYQGGFTAVDLTKPLPNLAAPTDPPDTQKWPDPLLPPLLLVQPDHNRPADNAQIPCGERLTLGPNGTILSGRLITSPPYRVGSATPGAVETVEVSTGHILRSRPTTAFPLDLLVKF